MAPVATKKSAQTAAPAVINASPWSGDYPNPPPYGYPTQQYPVRMPLYKYFSFRSSAFSHLQDQSVVYRQPAHQVFILNTNQQEPFNSNLIIAVLSGFFCCPIALIATLKALEAREAVRQGNMIKAYQAADVARRLALVAISLGILIWMLTYFVRNTFSWNYLVISRPNNPPP
ncbi:proline-rich transmembrane protein 1 [Plakobranchus ocellatus]|uniref:Proline-rich transmembrane protein 1 n=1 Tax=Plakobranchus ocellatus TaxID=259542 RepID=A0AAV3ZNN7_9GAST|nr:proline-rich transmembrane protein 1 [Plakobranchus ocellatus]